MLGLARADQLVGNVGRLGGGNREADADGAGLLFAGGRHRGNGRVHADELAGRVDERPTGITRIDRGINLNGIGDRRNVRFAARALLLGCHGTVERGHDAGGHRVGKTQRVAQRHDRFAHLEAVAVADRQRGQPFRFGGQFEHRDVGDGVASDDLRCNRSAVVEHDVDLRLG